MGEKITSINPKILSWARETSGTSLKEAEEKFGKARLYNWENGLDFPTYSQLKDICEFYRKPVAVCFFPEPPVMKNLPASCRTLPNQLQNVFSRKLVKAIDEARVMQLNLYELNGNKNPSKNRITDKQFNYKDIDRVAAEMRDIFGIDISEQKRIKSLDDAFELWRDRFYQVGVYVFKSAFQDDDISGFCLYDDEFPIIYVNNTFAISRQIFTLFHELYHIIYKTSGVDIFNDNRLYQYLNNSDEIIEKYCNLFAGKFLVPEEDFNKAIKQKKPTNENIVVLANTYCVSREVILRKFLDRNIITPEDYSNRSEEYNADYFRMKLNKKNNKSSGNYYNTQATYKGKQYLNLVFKSYYSKKISLIQLSQYMNMKIPSIRLFAMKKGWGNI